MPAPVRDVTYTALPGSWHLSTARPAPDLAGVVREYWEVEGALGAFRERVLVSGQQIF